MTPRLFHRGARCSGLPIPHRVLGATDSPLLLHDDFGQCSPGLFIAGPHQSSTEPFQVLSASDSITISYRVLKLAQPLFCLLDEFLQRLGTNP
jgi:hypothetical protein